SDDLTQSRCVRIRVKTVSSSKNKCLIGTKRLRTTVAVPNHNLKWNFVAAMALNTSPPHHGMTRLTTGFHSCVGSTEFEICFHFFRIARRPLSRIPPFVPRRALSSSQL
ncbi:unnamed protein product, partial [Sphacelaria rigidula]